MNIPVYTNIIIQISTKEGRFLLTRVESKTKPTQSIFNAQWGPTILWFDFDFLMFLSQLGTTAQIEIEGEQKSHCYFTRLKL